jgi:exodeoxyribonuclease-5
LVEAGAGSGKTALMAGRVALLMAKGISPKHIAAITFTELAAGQLLTRISDFVDRLLDDSVPVEMCGVLDGGLTDGQREYLESAKQHLGELTASTIHGFAQRLVQPYPVEADIDPGATILDPAEANLVWEELLNQYLRDELDGEDTEKAIVAFFENDSRNARAKIAEIAGHVRKHAEYDAADSDFGAVRVQQLLDSITAFQGWMSGLPYVESSTEQLGRDLERFGESYSDLVENIQSPRALTLFALNPPNCSAHTKSMTWKQWRRKTKWEKVARDQGASKEEGTRISGEGDALYQEIGVAWQALHGELGVHTFGLVTEELRLLVERYKQHKRSAALMDFDDLLLKARALLRNDGSVRRALAERYQHVLVDEFQDTDPVQVEILWRLCGEGEPDQPWQGQVLRDGALFCVGDPKQAIYRFRGADVNTYIAARDEIRRHFPENVLVVTANFRSVPMVLEWVNEHFASSLSQEGQPGFTSLSAVKPASGSFAGVFRLDVEVNSDREKPTAPERRNAEALAVAELCQQLIGRYRIPGEKGDIVAKAGDIALLAPVGTDLWRYERELENRNIPVASQAGKGFFRRQEVQDLIAITRTITDARDTVALGALLRGPVVGLTEQELLGIVESMPVTEGSTNPPRLDLWTPLDSIEHPLARDILSRLQGLARQARSTTPFELLAQAVEELRVRPILSHRHPMGAERPLANVDLFLEMAQSYSGRGLHAFARDMRLKWEDGESELEGRPDSEEQAVHMITMHSSKGLEWPIVILINTISTFDGRFDVLVDRNNEEFHYSIGKISSETYDGLLDVEKTQHAFETTRLLYVACTRPEQLLVCPNLSRGGDGYLKTLELKMDSIPAFDVATLPDAVSPPAEDLPENIQDEHTFSEEATHLSDSHCSVVWKTPSSHESRDSDSSSVRTIGEDPRNTPSETTSIQGGPVRGTLIHKLMEEVINGEIELGPDRVIERAVELLDELEPQDESAKLRADIDAREVADSLIRTCALPEIEKALPGLIPEFSLYGKSSTSCESEVVLISGIADAVLLDEAGEIELVIDWKSDVEPDAKTRTSYRQQVSDYLLVSGAKEGWIVYFTSGEIDRVSRPSLVSQNND